MTRVCIIGAGPSGLAQLRAFDAARRNGLEIPEIVCFEKQEDWGGLWNYTWRTGLDEFGEPVHCSMYRYLWSNGPKECLELSDYSFEEHFGHPIASYPPRAVLRDYIMGRLDGTGMRDFVRFRTAVKWVTFDDDTQKFTVTVKDLPNDRTYSEEFDFVVCASGHFSTPNIPEFPGMDRFPGRVLHAHDFRAADEFAGKDLLIVGSSYSAEDIASQCYKYGCKSVTFSYRSRPLDFKWPDNFHMKPLLTELKGRTAHFVDGSTADVDAIVLCTGYLHYFPFLPDSLRLVTNNRLYPTGMYKGIFWQPNPKLMYLGMQDQYYTFNMFDAQAWVARDFIMGSLELPALDVREEDIRKWRAEEEKLEDCFQAIDFQTEYVRDLIAMSDYPMFDVDEVAALFKEWEHDKKADIMGYRNKGYRSVKTGNLAPPHHTAWLDALDDSMESYINPPVPKAAGGN